MPRSASVFHPLDVLFYISACGSMVARTLIKRSGDLFFGVISVAQASPGKDIELFPTQRSLSMSE